MIKLAVIGSGLMGRGIALAAAQNQIEVNLYDISETSLQNAKSYMKDELEKAVVRNIISSEEIALILQRVQTYTNLDQAVAEVELVIEAIPEIIDLKIELFKQLDTLCKPSTVLATNTSTMSPTEIAAQTSRADRCIAMHFFNPAHKMKLIEIVRGLDTSDETVLFAKRVGMQMKKETVEVNEFPGFVTSRMNCLIGNEAMNMLMEGVASAEDIDKALKLGLNHPMGPLALADLVGLDTRLKNMEYLYKTLGEKYRPCPLLIKYVKAGRLGKKSGAGFYVYE
ncbi:3-hydroxyacyl-CoA dehydrogenase family protein [Solibacillus sp. FSL K6-4121]|uniref:3-hydroxyacyl-CoA dehydrogenase family protein n=1 Tax=Solibacillus sp. FSL K6-4121 TaxID=2921505 RepID=UPI0030FD1164